MIRREWTVNPCLEDLEAANKYEGMFQISPVFRGVSGNILLIHGYSHFTPFFFLFLQIHTSLSEDVSELEGVS